MKRFRVVLLLALVAALGLSALAQAQVTLSYRFWDINQAPAMEAIARAFEEKNPGVKVEIEVIPWGQYWTNLETAATGRNLPDIFWLNAPNFELYAGNGMLLPIDDRLAKSDLISIDDYPAALAAIYNHRGKQYGIPKDMDTIGLWYNKELFDAAGIAYPDENWTWDDLVAAAKALTDEANQVWGIAAELNLQSGFGNTVHQAGGYIINEDRTKTGIAEPEGIAGLKFWTDLIHVHKVSPSMAQMTDTEPVSLFESGRVAMYFTGSWNAIRFANNEYTKDRVDVAVLPKGKERAVIIHGLSNVIAANTKHPEEAWKFVEFLGSREAMEIQAKTGTVIPAYMALQDSWVTSIPQFNLKAFMDQLDYAVPYPASVRAGHWQQLLVDCLIPAWSGEISIEDAARDAEAQIQEVLASEKR